jgi:hypothetical protein
MFGNFIYFIVALLVYATYQPSDQTNFSLPGHPGCLLFQPFCCFSSFPNASSPGLHVMSATHSHDVLDRAVFIGPDPPVHPGHRPLRRSTSTGSTFHRFYLETGCSKRSPPSKHCCSWPFSSATWPWSGTTPHDAYQRIYRGRAHPQGLCGLQHRNSACLCCCPGCCSPASPT